MTESGDLLHATPTPGLSPLRIAPEIIDSLDPTEKLTPMEREIAGMLIGIGYVERKATDPKKPGFNGEDVKIINKHVLNDALNPHRTGVLRRVDAVVHYTIDGVQTKLAFDPVPPAELPAAFDGFTQELEQRTSQIETNMPVGDVIDLAAWAHYNLFTIHPFYDGNSRSSRLLVDFIFRRAGLSYLTDWGLKDDEYKRQLEKTVRTGNQDVFKGFLAAKLIKRVDELALKYPQAADEFGQVKTETAAYLDTLQPDAA